MRGLIVNFSQKPRLKFMLPRELNGNKSRPSKYSIRRNKTPTLEDSEALIPAKRIHAFRILDVYIIFLSVLSTSLNYGCSLRNEFSGL